MKNQLLKTILSLCLLWLSGLAHLQAQTPPRTDPTFVTAAQYVAILNSVASTDPDHLYDQAMGSDPNVACIIRSGTAGNYYYELIAGRESLPVRYVNNIDQAYYEAAESISPTAPSTAAEENSDLSLKSNKRGIQITSPTAAPSLSLCLNETTPSLGEDILGIEKGAVISAVTTVALGMLFPEAAERLAGAEAAEDLTVEELRITAENTTALSTAGKNASIRITAARADDIEDHFFLTNSAASPTEENSPGRLHEADRVTKAEIKNTDLNKDKDLTRKFVKKKTKETSAEKAARKKRSEDALAPNKAKEARDAFDIAKQHRSTALEASDKTLQRIKDINKKIEEKTSSFAVRAKKNEWVDAIDNDETINIPKFSDSPNPPNALVARNEAKKAFLNIKDRLSKHSDEAENMNQSLNDIKEDVSKFFKSAKELMSDVYKPESLDAINTANKASQILKNTSDQLLQYAQKCVPLIETQETYLKQVDDEYQKAITLKASWGKGVLQLAKTGVGNDFGNFGLGEATAEESLLLSSTKMWNKGSKNLDGSINNYRDASWKENLAKYQSNFERIFNQGTTNETKYNGHFDIVND